MAGLHQGLAMTMAHLRAFSYSQNPEMPRRPAANVKASRSAAVAALLGERQEEGVDAAAQGQRLAVGDRPQRAVPDGHGPPWCNHVNMVRRDGRKSGDLEIGRAH